MATCTAERGEGRGLAVGLSLCPGYSGWRLCVQATCRGAALWAMEGEAVHVIHAGSPRPAQGPLPRASPECREGMNQSQLIRAFHAQPAQTTDLETAWSRSFSASLRSSPEPAQGSIAPSIPFD